MRTGLSQHTSLRQELRVNPRLYQAMDMLYMPMMDLQQHLKQELLSNPFLELLEPEEETPEQKDSEQEKEQKEKEEEMDWEEILLNGFEVGGTREQFEQLEYTEPVTVETKDLIDHLREQLQMLTLTPRQLLLAEEFLGNINEEGYLAASLEEIRGSVNQLVAAHVRGDADEEGDEEPAVPGGAPPATAPAPDALSSAAPPSSAFAAPAPEASADHASTAPAPLAPASSTPEPGATADAAPAMGEPAVPPADDLPSPPYYSVAEVEAMVGVIQKLDPPGIGARDLRECLLIQLREEKDTESLTYRLVDEAFPDLIAHRWNDLAKRFGVEPAKVQAAADGLGRLDPKPGLKYSNQNDGYIIPDLIVEKIGTRYQVFLNDTGMPRLRLSRSYQEIARDKKKMTPENREFIASKMNSANWMIQAIEQRRQTMLKVMNFIVDRQRDFFEKGIEYLKPLTLREVAEVINMHESTVSRVTNEKYVQTPRGVLPLKFFFSSALATASGEEASARSIRAKLQKMVADEDSAKPLTDQQIVHLFQEQGIQIARRTVAKYRDQLGILPARMRKRV